MNKELGYCQDIEHILYDFSDLSQRKLEYLEASC